MTKWSLVLWWFCSFGLVASCPCQHPVIEKIVTNRTLSYTQASAQFALCIRVDWKFHASLTSLLSSMVDLAVRFVPETYSEEEMTASCRVLVSFSSPQPWSKGVWVPGLCPGICAPVPQVTLPISWLTHGVPAEAVLSCSLTAAMIPRPSSHMPHRSSKVHQQNDFSQSPQTGHHRQGGNATSTDIHVTALLLRSLFWRRISECSEQKVWSSEWEAVLHAADLSIKGGAGSESMHAADIDRGLFDNSGGKRHTHNHHLRSHDGHSHHTRGYHRGQTTVVYEKRKIRGLVIWIGSQSNINLIHHQAKILHRYNQVVDENAILGWAATDDMYPCDAEAIRCEGKGKRRLRYLPASAMNFMPAGWACAQRRPLRSLAHALLLLDPRFVILVDDDTFVNLDLLLTRLHSMLEVDMALAPIVLGEFVGATGENGHLTTQGLFAGGSGYVLGQALLRRLVSHEVRDYRRLISAHSHGKNDRGGGGQREAEGWNDEYRSMQQAAALALVEDGEADSQSCLQSQSPESWCTNVSDVHSLRSIAYVDNSNAMHKKRPAVSAVSVSLTDVSSILGTAISSSIPEIDLKTTVKNLKIVEEDMVPINTRLIDFCANLMAGPNTCQHSDHSLGRCLMFGANASPVGFVCEPSSWPIPDHIKVGFCFMTPACNISHHLTCHRYKATRKKDVHSSDPAGSLVPVRVSVNKNHYAKHSSGFDGKVTDSYM